MKEFVTVIKEKTIMCALYYKYYNLGYFIGFQNAVPIIDYVYGSIWQIIEVFVPTSLVSHIHDMK